jgi:plastocyanin
MRSFGLSLVFGITSLGLLALAPADAEAQGFRRRPIFISPARRIFYYPPVYPYYYPPYRMSYGGYGYSMPYGGYGSNSMPYGSGTGSYSMQYGNPDSYGSPSSPSAAAERTVTVGVYDNYFRPEAFTTSPGTTVQWTNYGQHTHSIASDTNLWDPVKLHSRDLYGYTFTQPGTYHYHCAIHPQEMKGTIIVK